MKNELTYHGQMIKQECEALLKSLTIGDEDTVLSIAERLNNFVIEVVDGKDTVFAS